MKLTAIWGLLQALSGVGGMRGFRHVMEQAEADVIHLDDLIPAGAHAVARLNTAPPGSGVNVMLREMPLRKKVRVLPTMLQTVDVVGRCGDAMRDRLTPARHDAGADTWQTLADVARQHGAVEVGFARISEEDIFQGYAIPYRNAVVFTADMKKEAINTAPSYDALREVLQTYAALGHIALALTTYLRAQGYGAYPGFPVGGLVDYVRVAAQAGIGAIGYHGMLISPGEGTRQRINVVFTNMEIPEAVPTRHSWVLDFCARCQKCVRDCPPGAIFTTASIDAKTGRKSTVHYQKCLDYFGAHQGCAICVKVCPFSEAGYQKVARGFLRAQARVAA